MKKLFMILVIAAAITCAEVANTNEKSSKLLDFTKVEIDDAEFDSDFLMELYDLVSNKIKEIWNDIKGDIQYLKDKGYWDIIVKAAKATGKAAASAICSAYLSPIACIPIIQVVSYLLGLN